ncbi:MAG: DAK2 domain-containing protein [Acidimicrobiales bacterium]
MTPLERLGADDLRAVVTAYRDGLRAHQESINRLNVYPVPDGDTGTNMALTVESVLTELEGAEPDLGSVCKAIAHGSLMGARGNSGVILSQILRGMTATFSAAEAVDGPALAQALAAAADGAYQAVGRPVEGTILTVVREAAEAAGDASEAEATRPLVEVLEAARRQGGQALERTPEMLDVLRRAGVVDAGGAGFLLLLDAALFVVDGRPVPEPEVAAGSEGPQLAAGADGDHQVPADADDEGGVADLGYEVMYLLEAPDEAVAGLRDAWAALGDSIVVVGGEGMWNCHIHTDDIGGAIEAGIEAGRPRDIRVTDLHRQVATESCAAGRPGADTDTDTNADAPAADGRTADVAAGPAAAGRAAGADGTAADTDSASAPATTAVVAVASGEGLRDLFTSLGVASVVAGGQSMNPSTAQLLEAVEASAASQVVILPNNANIVAVAEQVDGLTDKDVRVVPSRGIPEGLAALLAYQAGSGVEENAKAMAAAAADVITGEVTRAVRASHCDAGPVAEGDWLGIGPGGIEVVEESLTGATVGLLDALVRAEAELVIVIEGEKATTEATEAIGQWLSEHHPGVELEVHHGGQPLYPYLLGIE